ncbi:MAG: hypothetical protein ACRCRW_00615 [Aeromonadaceae bacterium]
MSAQYPILALAALLSMTSAAAQANPANGLVTRNGQELGLTLSHYKYEEPNFMQLEAAKLGIDYTATLMMDAEQTWSMRVDLRYANGKADYSSNGTGTADNQPDWYLDSRALFGKDFDHSTYVLMPYLGLGYRYLFSDLRGKSSTGAQGYRRTSHYAYLPLGVVHRLGLKNGHRLESSLEFDYLLLGRQKSYMSDYLEAIGYPENSVDVTNQQHDGYGIRFASMYQFASWSVGPFLSYWNIDKSEVDAATTLYEPKNNTLEYGLKGAYKF